MSDLSVQSRRQLLQTSAVGFGHLAFSSLLGREAIASQNPLAPQKTHFPARAKRIVFLFMKGGPSHIDTFDPKPKLADLHLQEFQRSGERKSPMESGKRYYVESPFKFRKAGNSGADISDPGGLQFVFIETRVLERSRDCLTCEVLQRPIEKFAERRHTDTGDVAILLHDQETLRPWPSQ